jgi:mono/diheme cytochrome c family protein
MSRNNHFVKVKSKKGKGKIESALSTRSAFTFFFFLFTFAFLAGCGVRSDMQDQPRYKAYKKSTFFPDGRASRNLPEGTVARGFLKDDKAFFTGKIDNPNLNVPVETTIDATGNTLVTTFPNAIDEFPMPVTMELVDRGQDRYNIYCVVCHGPVGRGDGMIVRRGFPQPPTYHDDRLRNAPVGHFFDVMTNGWGKMNSYADKLSAADRWAVVAYIRTLQVSQNPEETLRMNTSANTNSAAPAAPGSPNANTGGGH